MEEITLGSASPRRLELLKRFGFNIKVKHADIEELVNETLSIEDNAKKIAVDKLIFIKNKYPNDKWILTADTFIAYGNKIIGKPLDKKDAFETLRFLSNKEHKVVTGVSIYSKEQDKIITEVDITKVTFKHLSDHDIETYLNFNEWQDAAGSYQIQNMGEILIEKINGAYSTVMGLPISRIYGMFVSLKFINPVI